MWDQKDLWASTRLDGVRWTNSDLLHQASHFADLCDISHLRFEVLAQIPPAQNYHKVFICQSWVCFARDAHTGCVWPWTQGWVPAPFQFSWDPENRRRQQAWVWFTAGAWLVPHSKTTVLGWTDPAPNPIWTHKQQQSSGEMSGGELERNGWGGWVYEHLYFLFYFCWLQHLIFLIFISKNAPFSFTLTHFELQDS